MASAGYPGGRFGSGSAAGVLLGLGAGLPWGLVFDADGRFPSPPELVGTSAVVAGVLVGVRRARWGRLSREVATKAEGSRATGGGGR